MQRADMTSRERVTAVLAGKIPDRVPFNFWMDRPRMAELDALLGNGEDFRVSYYQADVVEVLPPIPWFQDIPRAVQDLGESEWQTGSAVERVDLLLEASLPPAESREYCVPIWEARQRYPDRAIFCMFLNQLDILMSLRSMEDFFIDMYDCPETVELLCDRISSRTAEILAFVTENCDIDAVYLAGDIAGNSGALMSPEFLRRFWLPGIQKCVSVSHALGMPVLYHTDGRVIEILDILDESGVDGINPLQANLNSDEEFSPWIDRFIVYGGMDNTYIIPQGPVERIRAHVHEKFYSLGRSGHLILSSHDIQGDTPLAHIDAMVDEILRCRYE